MIALKKGDVVQLKSGGPKMTVVSTGGGHEDGSVQCAWHAKGEVNRTWFPDEALELPHLDLSALSPEGLVTLQAVQRKAGVAGA